MNNSQKLNESLHRKEVLESGDFFLQVGRMCSKIGLLNQGVMRGYVHDKEGLEVTTHFYQEGDMIIGSFLPDVPTTMAIQALSSCELSVANYSEVMSHVNKDARITEVITREFQKMNRQVQSRVVALLNLTSSEKYQVFLNEYPGLLNRIPHYYIAQYLGITPTQLSRVRKQFSQDV